MQFTSRHYRHLAGILRDIAQVAAAGVVIPYFIGEYRPLLAYSGLGIILITLLLSFQAIDKAQ